MSNKYIDGSLALTLPQQGDTWLDLQEMQDAMGQTFTEDFAPRELDRVAFTGATKARWKVPGINGSEEEEAISGIILHYHYHRVKWAADYGKRDEVEKQVLCSSRDGITGHGEPGGACKGCAFNKFVERANGTYGPKPCGERMYLYLLRPGMIVPVRVDLSVKSIKPMTAYFASLKKANLAPWKVVTTLGIGEEFRRAAAGKKGDPFSIVAPKMETRLSRLEWVALKAYQTELTDWLKPWIDYSDNPEVEAEEDDFQETTFSKTAPAKGKGHVAESTAEAIPDTAF